MTALPIVAALAAAGVTFVVTPALARWARARLFLDRPGGRRVHDRPVPRVGGVAIILGATAGLVAGVLADGGALTRGLAGGPGIPWGLFLGGGIAFGAGLMDDLRGLRPGAKLALQVAAALVVYGLGLRIEVISVGTGALELGWLSLPVTLLWIVGVTNAYNLVDGMDGLAAGLGIIAFGTIAAAAAFLGHGEVVLVAAATLGALAGFLPHNFNPARIFLGDSGSLFVGFVLAVLSVQGSMKSATAVIVAVPLFALFIPLLDTAVAILRRWIRGSPIMEADARHIHHRLLHTGLSHRDAVLVLYLVGAAFAGLGILLGFAPPPQLALIATVGGIASGLLLVAGLRHLQYDEFLLVGKVLASGPLRFRQAIHDRILAEEVARDIGRAESLAEIQDVLAAAAPELGLVRMEVCVADEEGAPVNGAGNGAGPGAPGGSGSRDRSRWKLEYPLPAGSDGRAPLELRLMGIAAGDGRAKTARRAVHVVCAAVSARIGALDGTGPAGRRTGRPSSASEDPQPALSA